MAALGLARHRPAIVGQGADPFLGGKWIERPHPNSRSLVGKSFKHPKFRLVKY